MTLNQPITNAIITAAGKGERMRPLTDNNCKPMVMIDTQPIIGHVLDKLVASGINNVVVNTHYKPESLLAFLQQYEDSHPGLKISTLHEDVLLDTGGGIKNCMTLMPADQPIIVVSGDSYWEDADWGPALELMQQRFDPAKMDMMLLLMSIWEMHPTGALGDYNIEDTGEIKRATDKKGEYAWTSVRIIKNNSLFDNTPDGPFSFLTMLDKAQESGRLHGLLHGGQWHHFTTPADVAAVNNMLIVRKEHEARMEALLAQKKTVTPDTAPEDAHAPKRTPAAKP